MQTKVKKCYRGLWEYGMQPGDNIVVHVEAIDYNEAEDKVVAYIKKNYRHMWNIYGGYDKGIYVEEGK